MFFNKYPKILYQFGDETSYTAMQNISVYVDLIDQIKDNINFYQYYHIQDGYRADTVSQQLYGSVQYYWTFYLLNDNLRENGWPLSSQQLRKKARKNYRDNVLTTRDVDKLFVHFQVGDPIIGQNSGAVGVITRRDLDLGQIWVDHSANPTDTEFLSNELVRDNTDPEFPQSLQLVSSVEGLDAIHHYEDSDGNYTDVDPYNTPSALLTPITYMDRFTAANDSLKQIKVLKPGAIDQVFKAYQDALRTV